MSDLLKGNRDSLPDHMTSDGDVIAWGYKVDAVGSDGKALPYSLHVNIHASGALSVTGLIGNEELANSLLDHAEDAVRGYHTQQKKLVIKGADVSLPVDMEVECVSVTGFGPTDSPLQDRVYAIACMQQAKAAVKDMHLRRRANKKIIGGTSVVEM